MPVWPGRVSHKAKDTPVSQAMWTFKMGSHGLVSAHVQPCGILTYATRPSHTLVCWAVWSTLT
ncbi:hypothetical protein F383_31532 [Gossypium arboreum]|uniref:Uncharacterized protein n=1 Tax=Gossypium arboreum TaxID=29729 RepID=A0A0B0MYQ9_GOSAR|nr:hypothetical protein F383_31532 [Gossypium arboreum]